MSKLDELVDELCPNGVEYKPLEKIAKISNGKDHKQLDDGEIPVYGSGGIMRYASQFIYDEVSVLIPRKGSLANIFYVDTPFWTVDTIFYTKINFELMNARFLYHFLLSENIEKLNNAGGVPSLTKAVLDKIKIPLPPLPVQEEIVHILDNFTELTEELAEELTEELTARKKQYEYYRDSLLTFSDDVVWKNLGEISKYRRGSFPQPYGKKEWYDGQDAIPFVQVGDIGEDMRLVQDTNRKISVVAQPKSVFVPKGSTVISLQGSIGRIAVTQYDAYIDRTVAVFQDIQNELNSKYFVYQLQRIFAIKEKTARGSTIKTITKEEFTNFKIPIPSILEQERIVGILDRFNAICNDISSGLSAEIKARQQQYEYYRDKLLTFRTVELEV